MGPWQHGGWMRTDGESLGDVHFGAKTADSISASTYQFPFFEQHLKGKADRNAWPRPPCSRPAPTSGAATTPGPRRGARPLTLCFRDGGKLSTAPPRPNPPPSPTAYLSDPAHPVPYIERHSGRRSLNTWSTISASPPAVPTCSTYSTPPLADDVALAGPLTADLWVATTGTDADFVVKLIDVYPEDVRDPDPNPRGVRMGGYQQLVRAEVMRGRFRDGLRTGPRPLPPGSPPGCASPCPMSATPSAPATV